MFGWAKLAAPSQPHHLCCDVSCCAVKCCCDAFQGNLGGIIVAAPLVLSCVMLSWGLLF